MDKIDQLLDAIDHPEKYSDTDIEAMMNDAEARELYHLMTKAKGRAYPRIVPDVDKEWRDFSASNFSHRWNFGAFLRINSAAVIIGVIATLAAVAAGISFSLSEKSNNSVEQEYVAPEEKEKEIYVAEASDSLANPTTMPEIIIFKEENLGKILSEIARYYNAGVEFKNGDVEELRLHVKWDQNKTLEETIELLNNFEQINIKLTGNKIIVE